MNKIITAQLDRVEVALTTLIDSIISYNPSISAAQELLDADTSLSKGLEQCNHPRTQVRASNFPKLPNLFTKPSSCTIFPETITDISLTVSRHQANQSRLLSLRATVTSLDAKITSDLTLLAATRKEVLALPATTFPPGAQREVPYEELLNYARNIAKFTIPPSWRPKRERTVQKEGVTAGGPAVPPTPSPIESFMRRESQQVVQMNGTTSTPTFLLSPIDATLASQSQQTGLTSSFPAPPPPLDSQETPLTPTNIGLSALPPAEHQWLAPLKTMPFTPWPTEEVMKMGALGRIQVLMEQGVDLDTVEAEKMEEEGGRVKDEEMVDVGVGMEGVELEQKQEPEKEKKEGVGSVAQVQVQVQMSGTVEQQQRRKPSTFGGLDLYDPDEEP
ncbi:MAG: hypothetical protein MMC33_009077 [Icmadophila ericetorum]|nr:hypothetical protein [Icmadophila ericetorum]